MVFWDVAGKVVKTAGGVVLDIAKYAVNQSNDARDKMKGKSDDDLLHIARSSYGNDSRKKLSVATARAELKRRGYSEDSFL